MQHIHLDPVGGIAGDMFAAALLDLGPELAERCLEAAGRISGVACALVKHRDHVLTGHRFQVEAGHHAGNGDHYHVHWSDIRARLAGAAMDEKARGHALGIFAALAQAEARVHGIAPDDVAFHEVGAADSIADIVAAAVLIAAQADADGPASWSVGPLPLGGGTVKTQHGRLPVPAPATALLLEGFALQDDGIGGERVTPTGAAILQYLGAHRPPPPGPRILRGSGIGFGTRALPGRSNVLRALRFARDAAEEGPGTHRDLAVIAFEVDDQTPEDLATGLERLRGAEGVYDVLQMPAFGKKGRMTVHIQVLAAPGALDNVVAACFRETSTIGLRTQIVQGRALARRSDIMEVGGLAVRVKRVERPGGGTAKAEADDLRDAGDYAARARLRRATEEAES